MCLHNNVLNIKKTQMETQTFDFRRAGRRGREKGRKGGRAGRERWKRW